MIDVPHGSIDSMGLVANKKCDGGGNVERAAECAVRRYRFPVVPCGARARELRYQVAVDRTSGPRNSLVFRMDRAHKPDTV